MCVWGGGGDGGGGGGAIKSGLTHICRVDSSTLDRFISYTYIYMSYTWLVCSIIMFC